MDKETRELGVEVIIGCFEGDVEKVRSAISTYAADQDFINSVIQSKWTPSGYTLLCMMCSNRIVKKLEEQIRLEIIKELIKVGSDVNFKSESEWSDFSGKTPLSLAIENGFPEIIRLLKEAGAKE
jgi:hypothetical protein